MDFKEQDRIKQLILLYLTGNISERESDELNSWRSKNSKNEEIFLRMTSLEHLENSINRFKRSEQFNEREWQLIKQRTFENKKKFNISSLLKYAAIFLLPLIIGLSVYYYVTSMNGDSETYKREQFAAITHQESKALLVLSDGSTIDLEKQANMGDALLTGVNAETVGDTLKYGKNFSEGEKEKINKLIIQRASDYNVVLSDGTLVYLNSESELSYPVCFNKKIRKVSVKGQAYFKVARDEKRPFIVDVNGMQIKVLGTSFCVQAYKDEEDIKTTLVEGKIKIISNNSTYDLIPGQQAVLDNKTNDVTIRDVDVELYTAWKNGRIVFERTSLKEIMNYLSRIYSINVIFKDKSDESIPFSINITKYSNFLEIVELIEKTNRVEFELSKDGNNDTVIIK